MIDWLSRLGKKENLTGHKFGRLTVLRIDEIWHCECDCGNAVAVMGDNLSGNNTFSCGCSFLEKVSGENSHFWNGVSRLSSQGYIYITDRHGDRVREHRDIAREVLGRELTSDEVVHHKMREAGA